MENKDNLIDCEFECKSYLQKVRECYEQGGMIPKFLIWLQKLNERKRNKKNDKM